ncbi:MAG: hypothetical protein QOJ25_2463 [Solirubrobacteraceae bacterium]|nr:hypothetical protein [Solirubrobacteraceae bacterium]
MAAVSWSAPVVVAHNATLDATASDSEGVVAAVFAVQGGPKDFGGVSSSVGLAAIVAGAGGAVSPLLPLSSSSTALDPVVAVAANRPVVAWLDSSGSATSTVWVWDAWSVSTPIVQVATGAYGAAPAVATDDRGDALVTWVDAAAKEVMAASSVGGGAFGAPTAVSADVTLSSPVATMDSQGTAKIAWQPYEPTTSDPNPPPGVVMAASAPRGGTFGAPGPALTAATGSIVRNLSINSDNDGRVLVSATVSAPPTWADPTGGPAIDFAIAAPGGAFSSKGQLPAATGGLFGPAWTTAPDGSLLEASPTQTASTGGLATTQIATNGSTSTQDAVDLPSTPTQPAQIARIVPGFDTSGDTILAFTRLGSTQPAGFGNPTAGSILSVVKPAGSGAWCPPQLVSGLMSPFFPIGAAYDGAGHGVILYQQTPYGTVAAAYVTGHSGGCVAPTTAPMTITLASVARADRKLHTATIALRCAASTGCHGKLVLLGSASRTLASGTVSRPNRSFAPIRVQLTSLGRSSLKHHKRVSTRAVLVTGSSNLTLRRVTLTRG